MGADVVSGNQNESGPLRGHDELYVPMIKRMQTSLGETGLLYVGDCKMSALSTRSYIHQSHNFYLMPLSNIGDVPAQLDKWVEDAPRDVPR